MGTRSWDSNWIVPSAIRRVAAPTRVLFSALRRLSLSKAAANSTIWAY